MKLSAAKHSGNTMNDSMRNSAGSTAADVLADDAECNVSGELVQTSTVEKPPDSTIHTNYDLLNTPVR